MATTSRLQQDSFRQLPLAVVVSTGFAAWLLPGLAQQWGGAGLIQWMLMCLLLVIPLAFLEVSIGEVLRCPLPEALRRTRRQDEWIAWWAAALGLVLVGALVAATAWHANIFLESLVAALFDSTLPWMQVADSGSAEGVLRQGVYAQTRGTAIFGGWTVMMGALVWTGILAVGTQPLMFVERLGRWILPILVLAIIGSLFAAMFSSQTMLSHVLSFRMEVFTDPRAWLTAIVCALSSAPLLYGCLSLLGRSGGERSEALACWGKAIPLSLILLAMWAVAAGSMVPIPPGDFLASCSLVDLPLALAYGTGRLVAGQQVLFIIPLLLWGFMLAATLIWSFISLWSRLACVTAQQAVMVIVPWAIISSLIFFFPFGLDVWLHLSQVWGVLIVPLLSLALLWTVIRGMGLGRLRDGNDAYSCVRLGLWWPILTGGSLPMILGITVIGAIMTYHFWTLVLGIFVLLGGIGLALLLHPKHLKGPWRTVLLASLLASLLGTGLVLSRRTAVEMEPRVKAQETSVLNARSENALLSGGIVVTLPCLIFLLIYWRERHGRRSIDQAAETLEGIIAIDLDPDTGTQGESKDLPMPQIRESTKTL